MMSMMGTMVALMAMWMMFFGGFFVPVFET